jgi:hypothetical protein
LDADERPSDISRFTSCRKIILIKRNDTLTICAVPAGRTDHPGHRTPRSKTQADFWNPTGLHPQELPPA